MRHIRHKGYKTAQPGARREDDPPELERDFIDDLNPDSLTVLQAQVEPALAQDADPPLQTFQFERHGYFIADSGDSRPDALVFNRAVTLKSGIR